MSDLVGRWAAIPAAMHWGLRDLRLDLTDPRSLRFELNDGVKFAVTRQAMQELLAAIAVLKEHTRDGDITCDCRECDYASAVWRAAGSPGSTTALPGEQAR